MNEVEKKAKLDKAISDCMVQPVGGGYSDILALEQSLPKFVDVLNELEIRIIGFKWWQYFEEERPFYANGLEYAYGCGSFEELPFEEIRIYGNTDISQSNQDYINYICDDTFRAHSLVPALTLDIPDEWVNTFSG